jgi:hypothetical protein
MGVPLGTGTRIGIDRNENGILDGDEPLPTLNIASASGKVIVKWSTNSAGFLLERATIVPGASWNPDTNLHVIVGSEFNVTNSISISNLFFRLKSL